MLYAVDETWSPINCTAPTKLLCDLCDYPPSDLKADPIYPLICRWRTGFTAMLTLRRSVPIDMNADEASPIEDEASRIHDYARSPLKMALELTPTSASAAVLVLEAVMVECSENMDEMPYDLLRALRRMHLSLIEQPAASKVSVPAD